MQLEDLYRNPNIKKLFLGVEGIENTYRQSFSLITILLVKEIASRFPSFPDFQSILFHIINRINTRLSFYNWDEKTSNQVLSICAKNLDAVFKLYNNRVNVKTDIGERLIGSIQEFKKEILK